jgi:hypothetical protein
MAVPVPSLCSTQMAEAGAAAPGAGAVGCRRGGRGNTRVIGVATDLTGGPHNFGLGIGDRLETSTEIDPQNFWGHSQTQSAMR